MINAIGNIIGRYSGGGAPALLSGTVSQGTSTTLDMTFNGSTTITTEGWSIETDGDNAISILSVSGSGTRSPSFELSRDVLPGENLTLSYDKDSGQTNASGKPLDGITGSPVVNLVWYWHEPFTGNVVNTKKGTITNPNADILTIIHNNFLRFYRTVDVRIEEFDNFWASALVFRRGVFSCILNRSFGYLNSFWRFRVVSADDPTQYISIEKQAAAGAAPRFVVRHGSPASSVVDATADGSNGLPSLTATNLRVRIVYGEDNIIHFQYWSGSQWTTVVSSDEYDLGDTVRIIIDSNTWHTDNVDQNFTFDEVYYAIEEYDTEVPDDFFLDLEALEYGVLEELHPEETYTQIKARRLNNFDILKRVLQGGAHVELENDRLEVHVRNSPINANLLNLSGKESASEIVLYPLPPFKGSELYFIAPTYGQTHNIENIRIRSVEKNYLYETYDCILKPSGVSNEIQITGEVRDGFWDDMEPGKEIFINWTFETQGQTRVVDSFDSETGIIVTTTNLPAVDSDTEAKFGTAFREDISVEDYLEYGDHWTLNYGYVIPIYGQPQADSGSEYTLNLTNVLMENCFRLCFISMGDFKINFNGDCTLKNTTLALNAFDRGQIGNYITINGKLRVEKCGEIIAGSISVLQPSANYGSGAYIHPSVVVKSYGELHLINNVAGSWRQYSSSGYGAGDPGDFSYYAKIVEQGSQVYTLLTSNNHHTVIDRIESNTGILRLRHDLTINGGFVQRMVSYTENFGQGDRTIELSNLTINVPCDFRHYAHATFNNCTYRAVKYTERNVCIIPPSKTCIVNGGEMITSSGVGDFAGPGQNPQGDQGSSFTYAAWCDEMTIEGLIVPQKHLFFLSSVSPKEPYYESLRKMLIKDMVIPCSGFLLGNRASASETVSNVVEGENIEIATSCSNHRGRGFPQKLVGKTGVESVAVKASETYDGHGTKNNVLEIDWSADEYHTSGEIEFITAILWEGTTKYVETCKYGRNIRLVATGGNITLRCFDDVTRADSNIIGEDVVISEGDHIDLVIERERIVSTGTDSDSETVGTGDGDTTEYSGLLSEGIGLIKILEPGTIVVTAGDISVQADESGVIDDEDVIGIVDPYNAKYQLIFTNPVPEGVDVIISYDYPKPCRSFGAWIIP